MNRNLRTLIPCVPYILQSNDSKYKPLLEKRQVKSKLCFDKTAVDRTRLFKPGDFVVFKDNQASKSWSKGMILRKISPRSYDIIKENGRTVNRDSQMMLPDKTNRQGFTVIPEEQLLPLPARISNSIPEPSFTGSKTEQAKSTVPVEIQRRSATGARRSQYDRPDQSADVGQRRSRRLAGKEKINYKI